MKDKNKTKEEVIRKITIIIALLGLIIMSLGLAHSKGYVLGWKKGSESHYYVCETFFNISRPGLIGIIDDVDLKSGVLSDKVCESKLGENKEDYKCYIKSVDFENNTVECACWMIR